MGIVHKKCIKEMCNNGNGYPNNISRGYLIGKIDLGTVKFCLEIVYISTKENKGHGKNSGKSRCNLVFVGCTSNDNTVRAGNLDSLHVNTCVLVAAVI
mmetsp:Transcript_7384/g.10565  ORF Transcript_7384/g.10565 Transcript_7384/m.10565 type:complete len:98 (+) Transcript_7384:86-379(+)